MSTYAEAPEKTAKQRECARRLWFDLELKRVPFKPETIGDGFNGLVPAFLEIQVAAAIRGAGVLERARVRSFDHRSAAAMRQLEPTLRIGLLIHHTAPSNVGVLLDTLQADLYCPDYQFVDAEIVPCMKRGGVCRTPSASRTIGDG